MTFYLKLASKNFESVCSLKFSALFLKHNHKKKKKGVEDNERKSANKRGIRNYWKNINQDENENLLSKWSKHNSDHTKARSRLRLIIEKKLFFSLSELKERLRDFMALSHCSMKNREHKTPIKEQPKKIKGSEWRERIKLIKMFWLMSNNSINMHQVMN